MNMFAINRLWLDKSFIDVLVFFLHLGLNLIYLTLYSFDWSIGERYLLFLNRLWLVALLLLLDQELLYLLPALVAKDRHCRLQVSELLSGPSANSILRIGRYIEEEVVKTTCILLIPLRWLTILLYLCRLLACFSWSLSRHLSFSLDGFHSVNLFRFYSGHNF